MGRGRRNYNSSGEFPKGFIDGGVAPAHMRGARSHKTERHQTKESSQTFFKKIKAVFSCEITYFKTKFT